MDWTVLFNLVGLLTVNLGIMNLLPIPALDGCKLLIILIEAITRRRLPPEKGRHYHTYWVCAFNYGTDLGDL